MTAPTAGREVQSRGTRPPSRGGGFGPLSLGLSGEASPLERQPPQGAPLPPGLFVGLAGSHPPGLQGDSTPRVFPFPGAPVILALGGGASQGLQAGDRAGLSSPVSAQPCHVVLYGLARSS